MEEVKKKIVVKKKPAVKRPVEEMDAVIEKVAEAPKPAKQFKSKVKPPYVLTVFRVEGHETWRTFLAPDAASFTVQVEKVSKAKVTEKAQYSVDRITGEVTKL